MQFRSVLASSGHPGRDGQAEQLLRTFRGEAGALGHTEVDEGGDFFLHVGTDVTGPLVVNEFRASTTGPDTFALVAAIGLEVVLRESGTVEQAGLQLARFLQRLEDGRVDRAPAHMVASALLVERLGSLLVDRVEELRIRLESALGSLDEANDRIGALERELENLRVANKEKSGHAVAFVAAAALVVSTLITAGSTIAAAEIAAGAQHDVVATTASAVGSSPDEVHDLALEVVALCGTYNSGAPRP